MVSSFQISRAELRQDIEYGSADGVSLRLDAHIPDRDGTFPGIVIVHGGGWVRGDRKTNVEPLFQPLADAGFAWFSISYRLSNDLTMFGAAIEDVDQAVRFVKQHASEFKVDPERLALIGESAGGQLASMAALQGDAASSVRAVVALYSPSDLIGLASTSKAVPDQIRRALQNSPYAGLVKEGLKRLSPIENVRGDMPPFLLIHGTSDNLVPFEQSERMCERMKAAGASCELLPVRGGGHGVRWWEASHLTGYKKQMVTWLEKQLSAPSGRS